MLYRWFKGKKVENDCWSILHSKDQSKFNSSRWWCLLHGEKQTIGVADGVGGWAKLGVDPGEYARQLMINSFKAILMEPEGKINLKRVLNQAFLDTNAKGSSTACIINLKDHVCLFLFFSKYKLHVHSS